MQQRNYMQLYANMQLIQLYATLCNYMQLYATMQLMQLYETRAMNNASKYHTETPDGYPWPQ